MPSIIFVSLKVVLVLSSLLGKPTYQCGADVYVPEHPCYGTAPGVTETCIKVMDYRICGVK